jgi:hypothetical protein
MDADTIGVKRPRQRPRQCPTSNASRRTQDAAFVAATVMCVTKQLDGGEALFARWLDERRYAYDFEPDWGVETCPDFRVTIGSEFVAVELESIAGWGMFADLQVGELGSRPMAQALKPMRHKIRAAAQQLKPLAGSGMPLVVAIANPDNRPVAFTAELLIAAMYGDPAYEIAEDPSQDRMLLGRNGKLTNDHPYVSAVMLVREESAAAAAASRWFDDNRENFETAEAMIAAARQMEADGAFGSATWVAIDLVDTVSDVAAPIPTAFSLGPDDRRWRPTDDGAGLQRVQ